MTFQTPSMIALGVIVILTGCGSRPQVRNELLDSRCFEGVAYGIDTLAMPDAPHVRDKIWLVLDRGPADDEGDRGASIIIDRNSLRYAGSWRRVGDSISLLQAAFPPARWMLHEADEELRGRLYGESDYIETDSEGKIMNSRSDWPASFTTIPCSMLARPSNNR